MKTKLGYTVSALLSLFLCAVMLCGAVLPTVAEEVELPSLDYSNPAIENSKSFSVQDLYHILLEREPTQGEALYWQAQELSLTYNDSIPNSSINTYYTNEVLDVTVAPYVYTATNGAVVTWVPETIKLETAKGDWEEYILTEQNGVYAAQISCKYSGDFEMKISYGCKITVPGSILTALREDAYLVGANALAQMMVYENEKALYDAKYAQYEKEQAAYEAYVRQKEAYEKYVVEKVQYDQKQAVYEVYLNALAEYEALIFAHDQWDQYYENLRTYDQRKKAFDEYSAYLDVRNKAVDSLAMFESVFVRESRGWCMYSDIMGSTVTQVLARQDELIAAGCNASDITLAGQATENLRVLLEGYNNLREAKGVSDHEKYKNMYAYYQANYDALKTNFCNLYKTLKGLYDNSAVSGYIALQERTDHYRQLVGHLFVVSTAFDTSTARNVDAWRIARKTLFDVIDKDVHYFEDGNQWYPSAPYPTTEVAFAEDPGPDPESGKPTVAFPTEARPTEAPAAVENPGTPPTVVTHPGSLKVEPKHPGPAPKSPASDFSDAVYALYLEVKAGTLSAPNGTVPEFKTVNLSVEITQSVSIQNIKSVIFCDAFGQPYRIEQKNYGEKIKCAALERETTAEFSYEFLGWQDADGNLYSRTEEIEVTQNITLYPRYRATRRMYTVTFVVNNEGGEDQFKTVTREYGTKLDPAQYVNIPPINELYLYSFTGWKNDNGEVIEDIVVTGNETYYGTIQQIDRTYTVTWVIDTDERKETFTTEWRYGDMPVFDGDISVLSDMYIYRFSKWDKTLAPVKKDVTYTALYRKIPLATCGNTVLDIEHNETEVKVFAIGVEVSVKEAALLAYETGKTLTVCWNDLLSVSFFGEELQHYVDCGTPNLKLQVSQEGNLEVYEFKYLSFVTDSNLLPQADVQFAYSDENGIKTLFELQTAGGWERLAKDQMTAKGNFKARRVYSYAISCLPNDYCDVRAMIKQATEGELVSIALECRYGYRVVGATIVTAAGETITVSGTSFQMPASVANITLQVEPIIYRVTFMFDGEVWSYAEYKIGEKIVLPNAPTKEAEEGYVYTFVGWGNVPASAMGEQEELVFEAEFSKVAILNDYDTGHNNNVLVTVVLPCVAAVAVLVVAFFIVRHVVRKKGGWRLVKVKIACCIRVFFKELKEKIKKRKTEKNTKQKQVTQKKK